MKNENAFMQQIVNKVHKEQEKIWFLQKNEEKVCIKYKKAIDFGGGKCYNY